MRVCFFLFVVHSLPAHAEAGVLKFCLRFISWHIVGRGGRTDETLIFSMERVFGVVRTRVHGRCPVPHVCSFVLSETAGGWSGSIKVMGHGADVGYGVDPIVATAEVVTGLGCHAQASQGFLQGGGPRRAGLASAGS
ncbi:unnamed protein product [Ostreobium quekettii]|uniref:Secreted protein n=1 Tax=Ostreobium quekettii TaxID=121088 RepID=A0A8S1IWP4_9CHLO|nr:unnamed protein product [Ostreobium quekettii]